MIKEKKKEGGEKTIPKQEVKQYLDFLNGHKKYMGLSEWKVWIKTEAVEMGAALAEIDTSVLEKSLNVKLGVGFLTKNDEEKANILFHELVHGRIVITQELTEEYTEIQDEHLANDIVRGFEQFGKLELPRRKQK